MKHLKFSLTAVILIIVGLITAAVAVFSAPVPKSDKPEDLAAFIASSKFKKLPDAKQEEYLRKMRPSRENRGDMRKTMASMTAEQRSAMFENMRALHEKKQIEELRNYFKMSKAEKDQYLDRKIAEQDQRMAEFAKRRAEREARKKDGEQQERRRPSQDQMAAMMKNRIETTAPEIRAARQKFFQDLMKRREATGKPRGRGGPPH